MDLEEAAAATVEVEEGVPFIEYHNLSNTTRCGGGNKLSTDWLVEMQSRRK